MYDLSALVQKREARLSYFYGSVPVNEAIAMIVQYWAREAIRQSKNGEVFIDIDSDGIIIVAPPREIEN